MQLTDELKEGPKDKGWMCSTFRADVLNITESSYYSVINALKGAGFIYDSRGDWYLYGVDAEGSYYHYLQVCPGIAKTWRTRPVMKKHEVDV